MGFSVYVPESNVQGSDIPFYILWNETEELSVKVYLPNMLRLARLYNANVSGIKLAKSTFEVSRFDVNGYLGGLLHSAKTEEALSKQNLIFEITWKGGKFRRTLPLDLFRCDIKIVECPKLINITSTKKFKPMTDSSIIVTNNGKGTGVIRLNILKESEIEDIYPTGFDEFKTNVAKDLKANLTQLRKGFPRRKALIEKFLSLWENPLPVDRTTLKKLRTLQKELSAAFESDEKFLSEFIGSVVRAIIKNLRITTDMEAFLAYVQSIGQKKLILLDAIKVIKVSPSPKKLSSELVITDLAQNKYDSIRLPTIEVRADKECMVPIYQILNSYTESR